MATSATICSASTSFGSLTFRIASSPTFLIACGYRFRFRSELHPLVLGEVPRVDVLASLQKDHLSSPLGQPVGENRSGGAAAHDGHVSDDLLGVHLIRLAYVQDRELADLLDRLRVSLPLQI